MPPKLKHGDGAVCSALIKYLHPAKKVAEVFPNAIGPDRLEGCIARSREKVMVNRKLIWCYVMEHPSFPEMTIHSSTRYVKVVTEGDPAGFFVIEEEAPAAAPVAAVAQPVAAAAAAGAPSADTRVEIDLGVFQARNNAEDIANVRAQGLDVDDDNDPAPENIPEASAPPPIAPYPGQTWGWSGVDNRYATGAANSRPSIPNALGEGCFRREDYVSCFTLFFPLKWLEEVLLVTTNAELVKSGEKECLFGEFLRYLGIWFLMACFKGFAVVDFWSKKEISIAEGAPFRFHCYMSGKNLVCIKFKLLLPNLI